MNAAQSVRRPGRRARFDRDGVVAAAVELLDEQGPTALSMAALAKQLDVTPMALYRVVRDRRDLECALVAHVFSEMAVARDADADWDEAIAAWMHALRDTWLQHPWVGAFLGCSEELTPGFLSALEALVRHLERAGFRPDEVAREMVLIADVTTGALIGHAGAPLPHAAALSKALLASGEEVDRARWEPIESALADYGDDEFFADLVTWTLVRLRAKAGGRTPPEGETHAGR